MHIEQMILDIKLCAMVSKTGLFPKCYHARVCYLTTQYGGREQGSRVKIPRSAATVKIGPIERLI